MSKVVIYSKDSCPYCDMAKELFDSKGIAYEEIKVDQDKQQLEEMVKLSNRRTVPQIFINGQSIGGYDDLTTLVKNGKLKDLL